MVRPGVLSLALVAVLLFSDLSTAVTPRELLELSKKHLGDHYHEDDVHRMVDAHPLDHAGNHDYKHYNVDPDTGEDVEVNDEEMYSEEDYDVFSGQEFIPFSLATAIDRAANESTALHVLDWLESGLIKEHHKELMKENSTVRDVPEDHYKRIFNILENLREGNTPVMAAARKGYKNVLKRLEKYVDLMAEGARPDLLTQLAPIHHALMGNDSEIVDMLTARLDSIMHPSVGKAGHAGLLAAKNNHTGFLAALIGWAKEKGGDIDNLVSSKEGTTPLMAAAMHRMYDSAAMLLEAGLDPLKKDQLGATAYHWAKWHADEALTDLFHSRGHMIERFNETYEFGKTILHYAVHTHNMELVQEAIARGVDMNVIDYDEGVLHSYYTPLENAITIIGSNAKIIEALIDAGGKVLGEAAAHSKGYPAWLMSKYFITPHRKYISRDLFKKFIAKAVDIVNYRELANQTIIEQIHNIHTGVSADFFDAVHEAMLEAGINTTVVWNMYSDNMHRLHHANLPLTIMLSSDIVFGRQVDYPEKEQWFFQAFRQLAMKMVAYFGCSVDLPHDPDDYSTPSPLEIVQAEQSLKEFPASGTCRLMFPYIGERRMEYYKEMVMKPYDEILRRREVFRKRAYYINNYVAGKVMVRPLGMHHVYTERENATHFGPMDVPRGRFIVPHFVEIKEYGPLEAHPPAHAVYNVQDLMDFSNLDPRLVEWPYFRDLQTFRWHLLANTMNDTLDKIHESRVKVARLEYLGYWAFAAKTWKEDPDMALCEIYLHRYHVPKYVVPYLKDRTKLGGPYFIEGHHRWDSDPTDKESQLRRVFIDIMGLHEEDDADMIEKLVATGTVDSAQPSVRTAMRKFGYTLAERAMTGMNLEMERQKKLSETGSFTPVPPTGLDQMRPDVVIPPEPAGPGHLEPKAFDQLKNEIEGSNTEDSGAYGWGSPREGLLIEKEMKTLAEDCAKRLLKHDEPRMTIAELSPEQEKQNFHELGFSGHTRDDRLCELEKVRQSYAHRKSLEGQQNVDQFTMKEYLELFVRALHNNRDYANYHSWNIAPQYAGGASYAELWRRSTPEERERVLAQGEEQYRMLKEREFQKNVLEKQETSKVDLQDIYIHANMPSAEELVQWPVLYGPAMA